MNNKPFNYLLSLSIHAIFAFALFYLPMESGNQQTIETPVEVGIGFGFGEGTGSGGLGGDLLHEPGGSPAEEDKEAVTEKKPAAEEVVSTSKKIPVEPKTPGKGEKTSKGEGKGGDGNGTGTGYGNGSGSGFGYDIEWGGGGKRRIYSYNVPDYPQGANKELDIRIRFSILPDGTVGRIFLLTKGDTRLENAAISSLRQWRFEPLQSKQTQVEQSVVIVFPFRLR